MDKEMKDLKAVISMNSKLLKGRLKVIKGRRRNGSNGNGEAFEEPVW